MTLRKNVGSQKLAFCLINATDGSALTGATVTAKISLDGAAQATASGSVTELAGGQYVWSPAQADTNANNIGVLFTATNAIPASFTIYTTAADPTDAVRLGLTALPAAGTASTLDAAGVRSAVGLASANLDTQLDALPTAAETATQVRTELGTELGRIDASVSSRLAASGYTAPANADISAIKAKTDNLPAAPASVGDIPSAATVASQVRTELTTELGRIDATVSSRASQTSLDTLDNYVDTEVAAIKAKTDNLPASPAATGDIPSAATVASQVRTELTTELARIDATVSSRASQTSVDTIDDLLDTEVAAIKAKTDQLTFTQAGQVDANVQRINDVEIVGDGATTPWGPA